MSQIQIHKKTWQVRLSGMFPCVIGTLSPRLKNPVMNPLSINTKRYHFDVGENVRLIAQDGCIELVTDKEQSIRRMIMLMKRFCELEGIKRNASPLKLQFCTSTDFSFSTPSENLKFELTHYCKPNVLGDEFTPNYASWETHEEKIKPIIIHLGKVVDVEKDGKIVPIHRIIREHCIRIKSSDLLPSVIEYSSDFYIIDKKESIAFICS